MKKITSNFIILFFAAVSLVATSSCKSTPKDEDIQAAVNTKIASMPEMSGITASVNAGVVTLTGECKDENSKALCETTIKEIAGVKSVINNCTMAMAPPVVEIMPDDPLSNGVRDAIKDFNGVTADVKDGVINLTGEIKKTDLPKLMMSLNNLKPKKINNHLTIKI